MSKQVKTWKASEHNYLHKDFHNALNIALEYLRARFGAEAVSAYLRQFAQAFYAPLSNDVRRRGLIALKEHLEKIYSLEGGSIRCQCSPDELRVETDFCPAVRHIRQCGHAVSPVFVETEQAVYAAICADTPFAFELVSYDPGTGRSVQRFYRRHP